MARGFSAQPISRDRARAREAPSTVIPRPHLPTWSRGVRRRVVAAVASATLLASMGVAPAVHAATPFVIGDVMGAVGSGSVKQFDPNGTLKNTLVGTPSTYTAGMAFDSAGNLYVTDFNAGNVDKYDTNGTFLGAFISGLGSNNPESLAFDSAGNLYVGQADGTRDVLKFSSSGAPLGSFDVATELRGSDWVDLAADQCTLFYTSEGVLIKRFNVCTSVQLADFATLPSGEAYALRIRPNGEVIVAATSVAYRLDPLGNLLQTYTVPGAALLFGMNLDPDGTSFWTGDLSNGYINRINIATGAILKTFNSSPITALGGLAVVGEIRAATGSITLTPPTATNPAGTSHQVTATVTSAGNPVAAKLVSFSVTAGPNIGQVSDPGECSVNSNCTTDSNGQVSWTYTSNGTAGTDTIRACFDDAGITKCATASKEWTAATDQAIAATGVPIAATEGIPFSGPVATFTDPDTSAVATDYTATINWGDGTPIAVGTVGGSSGSFTVSGSHVYAEEGTHTVRVVITDVDTSTNTATTTSTATVADAALTSSCAMPQFTAQAYAGLTATFSDASSTGTLSDFTATINWGDASSSPGTILGGPGLTPYTVSGSHVYTSTGPFTVTTTITDVGGSTTTATCTNVVVFAFAPGGGSFAIGDTQSAVGKSVLFWGAQWARNNPVTSGTTVSAFKGFALNPTVPTCRASWSTDPGNSTPPPAGPLPAYMGVIVTSRYSKSGSTISGDIVHIVVVRTDPGYDSNPGHAGTGTVVGQVC